MKVPARLISVPSYNYQSGRGRPPTFDRIARSNRPRDAATPSASAWSNTLTSRAQIVDLSAKFADDVVAVIGLGGTGSYVFDLLVKTPVKEIRGFDFDDFHVHTAYRSPGRLADTDELGKNKAEVYRSRYENFREGLRLGVPKHALDLPANHV